MAIEYYKGENLVLMRDAINNHFAKGTATCEVCEGDLLTHDWVELDLSGFVVNCSRMVVMELPRRDAINRDLVFDYYVAYDIRGVVTKRVNRTELENALIEFEHEGTLMLGVWELKREEITDDTVAIQVRISPKMDVNCIDDNWRRPTHTFVPEIP